MPRLTQEKYEKIIRDYESGLTQKEVGRINGIGRDAVGNVLKRFQVETREYTGYRGNIRRRWVWDYDFFKKENKITAYWAGFLFADGCLQVWENRGASVVLLLQPSDVSHVEYFCDDIGLSRDAIHTRWDGYVGIQLSNKNLPNDLLKWGIVERKSKNFIGTTFEPSLMPHFLRGWCDGDGSVYRYGRSARFAISVGNRVAADWYREQLFNIGYDGYVGIHAQHGNDNWKVYVGGIKQVEKICNVLMVDSEFCMTRKWNTFYENTGQMFEHVCEICGNTFLVSKYRHENEPENGRFCSRDCYRQYQNKP